MGRRLSKDHEVGPAGAAAAFHGDLTHDQEVITRRIDEIDQPWSPRVSLPAQHGLAELQRHVQRNTDGLLTTVEVYTALLIRGCVRQPDGSARPTPAQETGP